MGYLDKVDRELYLICRTGSIEEVRRYVREKLLEAFLFGFTTARQEASKPRKD